MSGPLSAPPNSGPTEGCRYCWMCRQACPVGHVTARETYTPHGWALMIESVARGQMTWTPETAGVMYACADCGLCQAHCVTDQPLPHAINRTRVALAAAGAAPAIVYDLDRRLRQDGGAHGAVVRPATATGPVAWFLGDAAPESRPAAIDAGMKLLDSIGMRPVPISAGRSSGLLASTLGLHDTAVHLAEAVLDDVRTSGASEVLVSGPADRWTFTHVYPARLGISWPEAVRIREVSDVLAEALSAGRLRLRQDAIGSYAYHDPCHTPRLGPTRAAPRALLAAAFGTGRARELFWREHRAHPCGATGGLEITHPVIADQLAAARLADAEAAGATWLFTDELACGQQLSGRSSTVTVRGLFEALAGQL